MSSVPRLFDLLLLPVGLLILLIVAWSRSRRRSPGKGYTKTNGLFEKTAYEHRQIAEEILGRKLRPWEVVHHINGKPWDNRPENLCIMPDVCHNAYHEWYNWIFAKFGNYPNRETQIERLKSIFYGRILSEVLGKNEKLGLTGED